MSEMYQQTDSSADEEERPQIDSFDDEPQIGEMYQQTDSSDNEEERPQIDSSDDEPQIDSSDYDSSDDEEERPNLSVQTDSCLQLSKHLWEEEELEKKNICFSPLSIYVILSLIATGSNGRTLEQMLEFLKSNSLDHLNSIGSQLIESVSGAGIDQGEGEPKLSFISGMWIENSWTVKPLFKEIVNSIYRGEAEAVDFKTKANEAKEKVNKWVEKETNGLIKDLLPPGSINQDTRLVLANALYFKGEWNQDQFDPTRTKNSEFHLLNGVGSVQVPFMTSSEDQCVSCFNGFKVLQLPYKQATNDPQQRHYFSMYIFLPNQRDGLGDLIEKVSSDSGFLDRHLPKYIVEMGEFMIPKFKISFGFESSRVLKKLGIVLPFDENKAELNEMAMGSLDGGNGLYVSAIHQKCLVEVDEVGTEAAAATTAITSIYLCAGPTPKDFVADHPFMFFIRDNLNGVVLFMGHVLNPLLVAN